ncbi:hypothetical protein [Peptacetobacter sp.]|uniref:hypothetical protein n=2 Tax=Peptacetobacter sp. TaxID=2991975 RepID=UPI002632D5C8|nr:hypothetical protein [Peptacetobacter sp.]
MTIVIIEMNILNIDRRINLKKEYNSLKEDFADIVIDRAENIIKKEVIIKSTYQSHFGMYELAILENEAEIRVINRKIDLANEYMKNEKEIDEEKIKEIVHSEELAFNEIIEDKKNRIKKANDYLKRERLTDREQDRMRDSLRLLVMKLHPVLSKNSDEKSVMMLEKALDSFIDNNYGKMRMLENIIDSSVKKEESLSEKDMINEIERLKKAISDEIMQAGFEKKERIFEMEEIVFDIVKVEKQKNILKEELKTEQKLKNNLKYKLELLEKIYNFNLE